MKKLSITIICCLLALFAKAQDTSPRLPSIVSEETFEGIDMQNDRVLSITLVDTIYKNNSLTYREHSYGDQIEEKHCTYKNGLLHEVVVKNIVSGNLKRIYLLDEHGRVVSSKNNPNSKFARQSHHEYHDELGYIQSKNFDKDSLLISETKNYYNSENQIIRTVKYDGEGSETQETKYYYDTKNQLIRTSLYTESKLSYEKHLTYNDKGDVLLEKYSNNSETLIHKRDSLMNTVPAGHKYHLAKMFRGYPNDSIVYKQEYDEAGNKVKEVKSTPTMIDYEMSYQRKGDTLFVEKISYYSPESLEYKSYKIYVNDVEVFEKKTYYKKLKDQLLFVMISENGESTMTYHTTAEGKIVEGSKVEHIRKEVVDEKDNWVSKSTYTNEGMPLRGKARRIVYVD